MRKLENPSRNSRLDGFRQWPPLHLGLELHVLDLQGEALPVHAAVLLSWLIMIIIHSSATVNNIVLS